MAALRRVLLALLNAVEASGEGNALAAGKFRDDCSPAPWDAVSPPFADCLSVRTLDCDGCQLLCQCVLAAESLNDGVVGMGHSPHTFGTFFRIVNTENIADDRKGAAGQNFPMGRVRSRDAVKYGARLQDLRVAFGHAKRPSFVRYLYGPREPEEITALADKLRKYEEGDAETPPSLVIHFEERSDERGLWEYVYKAVDGRMNDDLRNRVQAAREERETKEKQPVGRNIPVRKVKFRP